MNTDIEIRKNFINTALELPQVQAMKENSNISIRKALQQYTRKQTTENGLSSHKQIFKCISKIMTSKSN
jgi:hypothetical protein